MSRGTAEILRDALGHFDVMQAHAGRDLDDQLVVDAVCMRLSAGIETLATLDPTVRTELFGDDWRLMWRRRGPSHGPDSSTTTSSHQAPPARRYNVGLTGFEPATP